MAYQFEKATGDLVISGWENGIASSPFKGLGDIKSGNISTLPGEVSLSYNRTRQTQSKTVGSATLTADLSNTLVAGAGSGISTGLLRGTWITINSSSITNLSNSTTYYVLTSSGGNIQLSTDYEGSLKNDMGLTGTAGYTLIAMGQPVAWTATNVVDYPGYEYFVLDANGRVWKNPPGQIGASQSGLGQWSLIDYTGAPNADAFSGVFYYATSASDGYLYVVTAEPYYKVGTALGHTAGWTQFDSLTTIGSGHYHNALISDNGVAYWCNGASPGIDSLATAPGETFDPTSSATYVYTPSALEILSNDETTCLAQIVVQGGTNIVAGGLSSTIYLFNPAQTTSAFVPVFLAENFTQALLTVNNIVFVFAGSKGNIYVFNGSSVTTSLTVPDYIANSTGGNQDPFYSWGQPMYLRGRIYFSLKAPNCGGIWSFIPTINYYVEQDTGISLRGENENSYESFSGLATILIPSLAPKGQQANGPQFWSGWDDGTAGASTNPYGIDFSDTIPALVGGIIETDAIPTGTFLRKETFKQVEYKLATAPQTTTVTVPIAIGATSATLSSAWTGTTGNQFIMFSDGEQKLATLTNGSTTLSWVGGLSDSVTVTIFLEMVSINYRTDLNAGWTSMGNPIIEPTSMVSGYYVTSFEKTQWLQFQIILRSTSLNPTFTPLQELRLR